MLLRTAARPLKSQKKQSSLSKSEIVNVLSKKAASKKEVARVAKPHKSKTLEPCPKSDGCARSSINGWEWHMWSKSATPTERARARGMKRIHTSQSKSNANAFPLSTNKGHSARTNRVKMRNLLAAGEGVDLLKSTQLKVKAYISHSIHAPIMIAS